MKISGNINAIEIIQIPIANSVMAQHGIHHIRSSFEVEKGTLSKVIN